MRLLAYGVAVAGSLALIAGSLLGALPMMPTEVFGFVTGGWAVWLTVKQNIWNWPIGIANSAFYLVVFLQARLFADGSLQAVYIVLGFLGWYWWLRGGPSRSNLIVARTGVRFGMALAAILVVGTLAITQLLIRINDSAPFLDALTTVMSLIAQFMLTRKLLENWFVWISADVIYIGLYVYKDLYLTSILYAVFMAMCIAGAIQWRRSLAEAAVKPQAAHV